jgi:hypothetical protein
MRSHLPSRLSAILMPLHATVLITSSMSCLRVQAASLDKSPINTHTDPLPFESGKLLEFERCQRLFQERQQTQHQLEVWQSPLVYG